MGDHISKMESLLARLARMSMELPEAMQVSILPVSLANTQENQGTVASIKTIGARSATWGNVSMRLIE